MLTHVIGMFVALTGWGPGYAQTGGGPDFNHRVESVAFQSGPVCLAGAVVKPEGDGPFPAVVFAHGAGPATFDEPAFRVHANAFASGGFIVLLYDKRGSGGSGGLLDTSDYEDLAADLAAGVRYLRTRGDVMPDKIGILGRSEGGWVGTLAASNDSSLRFVILSSGSGVRPSTQTIYAISRALRDRGASVDEVKAGTDAVSALRAFYGRIARMDPSRATQAVTRESRDSLEKRLRSFARFAPLIPQTVRDPAVTSPAFFGAFSRKIEYDPVPAFLKARAALLEVIGSDDEVVDTESTIRVFEGLRKGGRDVTVRTLHGVGHSLVIMTSNGPRYPDDYPEFAVRWARGVIGDTGR
jgi:uncharacterized protein